jgi:pimeloyl-ACP methyl ester carboxylesterase
MLHFKSQGKGRPVLLIHGFPLNQTIWASFADELSKSFQVFTIDLPGFGESPLLKAPFSIVDVAESVLGWMTEHNIEKPIVIGHSLGGYVALEMVNMKPNTFAGLVLFHSTAYADSEEKKASRNKVLEFIEKNGVLTFTSNFIPPLFADQKHNDIEFVKRIATQSGKEAVVNYTIAMRDRPDRTSVLRQFPKPILFIAGEKDPGIPVESLKQQQQLGSHIDLSIVRNVAHMGMLEDQNQTLEIVKEFANKSNRV